jgi:hypothetical protein
VDGRRRLTEALAVTVWEPNAGGCTSHDWASEQSWAYFLAGTVGAAALTVALTRMESVLRKPAAISAIVASQLLLCSS